MQGKKVPVIRTDEYGNRTVYGSVTIAAKENYIDRTTISKAIARDGKCCGFKFKYATPEEIRVTQTNLYDQREVHSNCTVEVWKNSITGETSIGWWDNDNPQIGVNANE